MTRHFAAAVLLLSGLAACNLAAQSGEAPVQAGASKAASQSRPQSPRDTIRYVLLENELARSDSNRRRAASAMAQIDLTGTPHDFRTAYERYVAAEAEIAVLIARRDADPPEDVQDLIDQAVERSEQAFMGYARIAETHGGYSTPLDPAEKAAMLRDGDLAAPIDPRSVERILTQLRQTERLAGRAREEALRAIDLAGAPASLRRAIRVYIAELASSLTVGPVVERGLNSSNPDSRRNAEQSIAFSSRQVEEARRLVERAAASAGGNAEGLLKPA